MSGDLRVLNRQRTRPLDIPLLRQVIRFLLDDLLEQAEFDLTVHLVNTSTMARLNETHLDHDGPTDVITLDYSESARENIREHSGAGSTIRAARRPNTNSRGCKPTDGHQINAAPAGSNVAGEIFACTDVAMDAARRFRVPWTTELVRYVVHGVLHLRGHDDRNPAARRRMKRAENRLVRELAGRFNLRKLARESKLNA